MINFISYFTGINFHKYSYDHSCLGPVPLCLEVVIEINLKFKPRYIFNTHLQSGGIKPESVKRLILKEKWWKAFKPHFSVSSFIYLIKFQLHTFPFLSSLLSLSWPPVTPSQIYSLLFFSHCCYVHINESRYKFKLLRMLIVASICISLGLNHFLSDNQSGNRLSLGKANIPSAFTNFLPLFI